MGGNSGIDVEDGWWRGFKHCTEDVVNNGEGFLDEVWGVSELCTVRSYLHWLENSLMEKELDPRNRGNSDAGKILRQNEM